VLQDFSTTIGIETSAKQISLNVPLKDIHGRTQYTFICVGGSDDYLDELSDDSGINYVGPLGCRLVREDRDSESSLLSEDESAYWYSRGQIHDFNELIGACGKYPEYGAVRHFRLRGFELTMRFGDFVFDRSGHLSHCTLTLSVRRDATITSERAEQTGYLTPYKVGNSCSKVLRGNEPRMCRDWVNAGGSWRQCNKLK